MTEQDDPVRQVGAVLRVMPGLARVVAGASWRAATWAAGTTVRTGTEVVRRTMNGEQPAAVLTELADRFRDFVADGLRPQPATPVPADPLVARGAQLLRRSADVTVVTGDGHPAYARILSDLTPDEARILRYLYRSGPQPAIDIRTNRPLGIGSELVAAGLNMIAEYAGLQQMDRIFPYLTNLNRLGLVDFSKEQVDNPNRYQLIEAQPKVAEARRRAGRLPRIVHRSIRLTTFGEDFCRACLPVTTPGRLNGAVRSD